MKKLKIEKDNLYLLGYGILIVGAIVTTPMIGKYKNQKQINIDNEKIETYVDDEGIEYGYFEPGEHQIEFSKNILFKYESDNYPGYVIDSVEQREYLKNMHINYINTEPVLVEDKNTDITAVDYSDFGTPITEEKLKEYTLNK